MSDEAVNSGAEKDKPPGGDNEGGGNHERSHALRQAEKQLVSVYKNFSAVSAEKEVLAQMRAAIKAIDKSAIDLEIFESDYQTSLNTIRSLQETYAKRRAETSLTDRELSRLKDLPDQLKNAVTGHQNLAEQFDSLVGEFEATKGELEAAKGELEEMKTQRRKLEEEHEDASAQLLARAERAEKIVEELQAEIARLRAEAEQRVAELAAELARQRAEAESKVASGEEEAARLRAELESERNTGAQGVRLAEEERKKLVEALNQERGDLEALRSDLSQSREEGEKNAARTQEMEMALDSLRTALAVAQGERDSLRERWEGERQDLDRKAKQQAELIAAAESRAEEEARKGDSFASEIAAMKKVVEQSRAEREEARLRAEQEIEAVNGEKQELMRELSKQGALLDRAAGERSSLESEKERARSELAALSAQHARSEEEKNALQAELEEQRQRGEAVGAEREHLEHEYSRLQEKHDRALKQAQQQAEELDQSGRKLADVGARYEEAAKDRDRMQSSLERSEKELKLAKAARELAEDQASTMSEQRDLDRQRIMQLEKRVNDLIAQREQLQAEMETTRRTMQSISSNLDTITSMQKNIKEKFRK
ncbi:MAG: hypothetical protein HQL31_01795 [Planctomycetes bacterium]|nr:hypothetical protein [Planctomycetota bacterium]